jgi:hypothetical protein
LANPTTNYGFVLPTATDLVTDLPADFDVALQGVDTRLKALQPGTTLGDLAYSSATANTNTRLGIGTSGQVLSVSGGVPAWTTAASGGMTLISTTALSGTSVTLSSLPQTYKKLVMYISGATNTAVNSFIFTMRLNGITGSVYSYNSLAAASATVYASAASYTGIRMNGSTVNYSSLNNSLTVEFDNYAYNKFTAVRYYGIGDLTSGNVETYQGFGGFMDTTSTAALTSITIYDSYGSRTFNGGTIYLYGVN